EERYADAAELARDLRECERQLAAAGAAPASLAVTKTQALPTIGVVTPPQPTLVDAAAQSSVLAQTVNRTREADRLSQAGSTPPAHGLASSFDSAEATQRLASLTGAAPPQTATQAIKSMPREAPGRWRRRDWLVVVGAGACGLLAARAILRKGR